MYKKNQMNWINWKKTGERERGIEKQMFFFFLFYCLERNNAKPAIASAINNVKIVGENIETDACIFFKSLTIYLLKY